MLGLVGGFAGIVWSALLLCLKGYSEFALERTLVASIFTKSPPKVDDQGLANEVEARGVIANSILESKPYSYNYLDH